MYREIQVMNKVDHPHIIKYFETYDEKNFIYLVMELCQNGSLEDKIKDGPLPEKDAALYLS
jgi:calcium-dependent protein kinase